MIARLTRHPVECPFWEYDKIPGHDQLLYERTKSTLEIIARLAPAELLLRVKDTRSVHGSYFRDLTPPATPYYAGNYRGADYLCLRSYEVQIKGDNRVGHPASMVAQRMLTLASDIEEALRACEIARVVPNSILSPLDKLAKTVDAATAIFVYFLEIHPYANGNGHAARFILTAILARYGIVMRRWRMHPRPSDPPYTDAIRLYRSGYREPLVRFVLGCI